MFEEITEKKMKAALFTFEDANKLAIDIPEINKVGDYWHYTSAKQDIILPDNVYLIKQIDDWIYYESVDNFNKKFSFV